MAESYTKFTPKWLWISSICCFSVAGSCLAGVALASAMGEAIMMMAASMISTFFIG